MENKQEIRSIYSKLQGWLANTPNDPKYPTTYDPEDWEQYNSTIVKLNELTVKNYDEHKLKPTRGGAGKLYITKDSYRQKLGGLIAQLRCEYSLDEVAPFAEKPSTIINLSQNQNQSVYVQLQMEVSNLINEKLGMVQDGSKEKTFLEKIKESLSSVKNVSQLVTLFLMTAQQVGITIGQLKTLFS
ncbi:MAG: hypothetical protein MUO24_04705 [Desulfobacterales bacterium]|nr:hypothetical protein [Desulfobacterales bacterium]